MRGVRIPIACTLSSDDATDRIAEWRAALDTLVAYATRTARGRVELRLIDGAAAAGELVDLARREKSCCDFFTFTVEIDARGASMIVEVPEEAAAVLDDFVALRRS